jgi:UDP-N-acetylmuramyl pentapeptide phosphotransferase/UDP-N-acetylglucosamine-1-phosphate transferase
MMATDQLFVSPLAPLLLALGAAVLCAALIAVLFPLLRRYALARPNARSSHRVPTPQGGGIAIVAATLVIALLSPLAGGPVVPLAVLGAALLLALVGAWDDLRPMGVAPRLALQALAVAAVLASLPADLRVVPALPVVAERALEALALLWFVNLTNFMDGLDWLTVVEMLPLHAVLAVLVLTDAAAPDILPVALGLAGALAGFAPFNRPVAKLFMGDVGSLPIGLLTGWALLMLAGDGHLAAALLLPLYYLVDATLTLVLRLRRGEKVWQAHRSHFYQRATDNGFTVLQVVAWVAGLNLLLAALALVSVRTVSPLADFALLLIGLGAVALLLRLFARPRA